MVKVLRVNTAVSQTADKDNIRNLGGNNMKLEELNMKVMEGLSGQARENFIAGLESLNMTNPEDRKALRESITKLRPDFTEEQIEIFIEGR